MTDRRRDKKNRNNLNNKKPKTRGRKMKKTPLVSSRREKTKKTSKSGRRRKTKSKTPKRTNRVNRAQIKHSNNQNKELFLKTNPESRDDVKTTSQNQKNQKKTRKNIRFNRPGIIFITFLIFLLFLYYAVVLFDVQVLKSDEMTAKANNQYYRKMVIPAKRGDIYDRNGKLLATSTNVFRVGVTPKHVYSLIESQTQAEIVDNVASILAIDATALAEDLSKEDESYVQIAKDIPQEQANLLDQYLAVHQIGGVRLDAEPERIYFNDDVASQIVGFATNDESGLQGRLGVEYSFNEVLNGKSGYLFSATDNYLNTGNLPFSQSTELASQNGDSIHLTLDYDITAKLQEHVKSATDSSGAQDGGMGIVMNVKTGEVLGLASYPYFSSSDPTAKPANWDEEENFDPATQETVDILMGDFWTNKAVSSLYEVGSTFKMLTLAMGLEENITHEEKVYSDAPIQVLDYTIKSWTGDNIFGQVSTEDAFLYSLNPPFVQIALELGVDTFYDYVEALGLRQKTGIELPGEIDNIFHESPTAIDLATLSFGEQSSMNLVSYAKALSAVVNGGNLMKPTIVKQISNDQGAVIRSFEPQIERRVFSEKTSDRVNKLLSRNDSLQGLNRVSSGYDLGGKTSTSVNEQTNALTLSYASFAPMDDPEILVLIVAMNSPRRTVDSNSLVNNVSGMVDFTLDHLNIEREYTDEQMNVMEEGVGLPELQGESLEGAMNRLNYMSLNVVPGTTDMKPEDLIASMVPLAGTPMHYGSNVFVYPEGGIELDLVDVPDFSGKNFNECILVAKEAGVTLNFTGDMSGLAVSQSIMIDYRFLTEDAATTQEIDMNENNEEAADVDSNDASSVQKGSIINIVLESVSAD